MKKLLGKKLMLNKKTVVNLKDTEMNLIKGATLLMYCTESCSLFLYCCKPTNENIVDPLQDKNQG